MSTVITNSCGLRPVLVDFQNSRIKPGEEHNLKCRQYISGVEEKPLVGVTSTNMLYTAQVKDDEFYNNCLLILDKNTGKMKLIQIDQCTVRPVLLKDCQVNTSFVSASESSVLELNKQFGSKRTKRLTEQRERLTMNIEAVKDQLEETVKGKDIF